VADDEQRWLLESLDAEILKFNGGLFANATAIALNPNRLNC